MLSTKTLAKHILNANSKYNVIKVWNPNNHNYKIINHSNLFNVITDAQIIDHKFHYNYSYYEYKADNKLVENEFRMRLNLIYKSNKFYENFVHLNIDDYNNQLPIIYTLRNNNKNLQSIGEIDKQIFDLIDVYRHLNLLEFNISQYYSNKTSEKYAEILMINKNLNKIYIDNVVQIINLFGLNSVLHNRFSNLTKVIRDL